MPQLDLDDLPPKIAALLTGLTEGETLLLVQHGAVVARLVAAEATPVESSPPSASPEQHAREVFENFRSAIEDEF